MKTLLIWIVVLAVVGGGIYWVMHKSPAAVIPNTETQTTDNTKTADYTPPPTSPEPAASGVNVNVQVKTSKTVEVSYTDSGFNPKTVNISVGDTVKFTNNSSKPMWIGSASHPSHTVYDGTSLQEHCAAGTTPSFDECKSVGAGGTYSFTFTKSGTFGYHNHSASSDFGSVVVK